MVRLFTGDVSTYRTDMTSTMLNNEEKVSALNEKIPLGRPSQIDEQAGMAVFLLSDHSNCE